MQTMSELPLRDIHLPPEPSIWPLAPGWWALIVLTVVAMVFLILWTLKLQRRRHLNNKLQAQIQDIYQNFQGHKSPHQLASDMSVFLKRFVKFVLNNPHASTYTAERWNNYLKTLMPEHILLQFSNEMNDAVWNPKAEINTEDYVSAVRNFISDVIKKYKIEKIHA